MESNVIVMLQASSINTSNSKPLIHLLALNASKIYSNVLLYIFSAQNYIENAVLHQMRITIMGVTIAEAAIAAVEGPRG